MPDYNPAVAAGIQVPQNNFAGTLGTVANIQAEQARTGLYNLQALQQQRQYNALQAYAAEMRGSGNSQRALQAYSDSGGDPGGLGQLAGAASQMTFMRQHSDLNPQGAEANANIARAGAETALTRAKIPGAAAESDVSVNAGAAQAASQYANDPSPQSRAAMIDYTRKYKGDLAANDLAKLSDSDLMARAKGHIGATPQGNEVVKTETPEGAPQYQTKAQFIAGGPQVGATPGAIETQKQTINYLQGPGAKAYSSNQSLMQSMKVVDNDIERLGPKWMGPGSSAKSESFKALNSGLAQFGIKPIAGDAVGSSEELGKESIRAGYQLGSSQFGGSREASQTIQTSIKAVVSQGNSYLGAKMVSATIQAAAQRNIDLYEYQAAHPKQLPAQSEIEFNKAHPPQEYAMRGIVNGVPQTDRQYLIKNPALAPRFDKAFGPGVSQAILGQQ